MSGPPEELCTALENREHTKVDDLIGIYGGFTNVVDKYGRTAFHIAAGVGDLALLKTIWNKWKPPIGQKTNDGRTALHWGNMGCRVSKGGIQNQKGFFWLNINIPTRKLLYFVK